MVGLPAFIRYGDADDNVPPLNLRRWHRLLSKYSADHGSTAPIILDEQPGKGHWFDNIMDDAKVQAFFDQAIANGSAPRPELPPRFTFANLNPSTSGSRGGIRILQTKTTGRIASFAVDRLDNGTWILESNNVATLELRKIGGLEFPETLVIDGHPVQGEGIYRLTSSGVQQIANVPLTERSPANYGPARRVFETGPFWIVYAEKYRDQALWLAQEVFARGRFSPELRPEYLFKAEDAEKVNLVVLGGPEENAAARWISNREVGFESGKFKLGGRTFASPDQGVVYLTPTSQTNPDRLALVVAGNSPSAVEFLMRYVPAHSEKRAPDYMVCDRSRYWQGLGACVAGGFWDAEWKFDRAASYGI